MEQKHERQSDGHFGSGHCENEKKHDLTVRLSPSGSSRDEGQSARIEHDLNAHECEDQIPSGQKSG